MIRSMKLLLRRIRGKSPVMGCYTGYKQAKEEEE